MVGLSRLAALASAVTTACAQFNVTGDGGITILRVRTSQNGCPAESLNVTASASNPRVTIGPFPSLNALWLNNTQRQRVCIIRVYFYLPRGTQASFSQSALTGTANIPDGYGAKFVWTHSFSSHASNYVESLVGVKNGNFSASTGSDREIWSSCNGADIAQFSERVAVFRLGNITDDAPVSVAANAGPIQFAIRTRQCADDSAPIRPAPDDSNDIVIGRPEMLEPPPLGSMASDLPPSINSTSVVGGSNETTPIAVADTPAAAVDNGTSVLSPVVAAPEVPAPVKVGDEPAATVSDISFSTALSLPPVVLQDAAPVQAAAMAPNVGSSDDDDDLDGEDPGDATAQVV